MTAATWHFYDEAAHSNSIAPQASSYLYFPLMNESGLVSVVSPTLHGDIKTDQNTFLTLPVSVEDLHTSRSARNFWVNVEGCGAWSVTGNSAPQIAQRATPKTSSCAPDFCGTRSSARTRRWGCAPK